MTIYASSNHFSDNDESTATAKANAALLREPVDYKPDLSPSERVWCEILVEQIHRDLPLINREVALANERGVPVEKCIELWKERMLELVTRWDRTR